jgi:hypothetical protein
LFAVEHFHDAPSEKAATSAGQRGCNTVTTPANAIVTCAGDSILTVIVFLRLYSMFGLERLGVVLKAHIDNTDKKDSSHYLPLTTACTKCGIYARSFLND